MYINVTIILRELVTVKIKINRVSLNSKEKVSKIKLLGRRLIFSHHMKRIYRLYKALEILIFQRKIKAITLNKEIKGEFSYGENIFPAT